MSNRKLVIGTRSSRLALLQCYQAIADIQDESKTNKKYKELIDTYFKLILTTGDIKQGTPEAGNLTKKSWVDAIEAALLNENIDVAIHSGKDVPKDIEKGTKILPLGKRNIPFDVFIGKNVNGQRIKFSELGAAVIGTASLRRQLFLKKRFPAFEMKEHRGNVPTRILKLDKSDELDGIILAGAGLNRLNVDCDYEILEQNVIIPSALQGTLVAQIREDDVDTESLLMRVHDEETAISFMVERSISEFLEADCSSCVGIYCHIDENNQLNFTVSAIDPDTEEEISHAASVNSDGLDINNFLDQIKSNSDVIRIKQLIA